MRMRFDRHLNQFLARSGTLLLVLTDQELLAVIRWIQAGAPFPTTNAPVTALDGTDTSTTFGTNSNYLSKP